MYLQYCYTNECWDDCFSIDTDDCWDDRFSVVMLIIAAMFASVLLYWWLLRCVLQYSYTDDCWDSFSVVTLMIGDCWDVLSVVTLMIFKMIAEIVSIFLYWCSKFIIPILMIVDWLKVSVFLYWCSRFSISILMIDWLMK